MRIEKFPLFSRLAATVFVSFSLAVTPVQASEVAGEAVNVQPNASLKNPEGRVTLQVGMDVKMGDLIKTNRRGEAQLIFTDETKLVVGPNSSLVVESYLLRGNNRANNFTVKTLSGTFRMISGKSQKSAYKIKTPTATIGIRGTTFDMAVRRRNTEIFMYSGAAQVCTDSRNGTLCANIEPSCSVARATRNRGVQTLDDEDDVIESVSRGFPYLGNDGRFPAGFQARAAGCSDETISRLSRRARARAIDRAESVNDRGTRETGDGKGPEPSEPSERPERPERSEPPDDDDDDYPYEPDLR